LGKGNVMGVLREKMERDLKIRGYSEKTVSTYLNCVRDFVVFHGRAPDQMGPEEINQFQYHLTEERKVSWAYFNQAVCALRFFYRVTLGRDWVVKHIPYGRHTKKMPVVLSQEEVEAIFTALANVKHRAMLMTLYTSFSGLTDAKYQNSDRGRTHSATCSPRTPARTIIQSP